MYYETNQLFAQENIFINELFDKSLMMTFCYTNRK